jgi:hypothetical protein
MKEIVVEIDFDDASREWRKNKIKGPNCTFKYRCDHIVKKTQKPCQKVAVPYSDYCKRHQPPKTTKKQLK